MHNKTRTTQNRHNQFDARQTTDQQQQNHRLTTESHLSHRAGGFNALYWYQILQMKQVLGNPRGYRPLIGSERRA